MFERFGGIDTGGQTWMMGDAWGSWSGRSLIKYVDEIRLLKWFGYVESVESVDEHCVTGWVLMTDEDRFGCVTV